MTPDEFYATDLDLLQINTVISHIHLWMKMIWLNARRMTKENLSELQTEYLDQILDAEHRAYWMLRDLPALIPQKEKPASNPPDFTITTLLDVEDELIGSYRRDELGQRLLRDAPDLLDLTLHYRELYWVVRIVSRLLIVMRRLLTRGAEITFRSSKGQLHDNPVIHFMIDCCKDRILTFYDDLFFQIHLPYQELQQGYYATSGLEFMMAKRYLLSIGGDFIAEKHGDTLKLELVIPTFEVATESTKDFK
jgi:hypothetical protein